MKSISFSFKMYPKNENKKIIDFYLRSNHYYWNVLLKHNLDYYSENKKMLSIKFEDTLKWGDLFLHSNHNILKITYDNFYKSVLVDSNNSITFPKYKHNNQKHSFQYDIEMGNILITSGLLSFDKIINVRLLPKRELFSDCHVKTIRIFYNYGNYYLYVFCTFNRVIDLIDVNLTKAIGLDFSLDNLYVDSNNNKGNIMNFKKDNEEKLLKLRQKIKGKTKGSREYDRISGLIVKLERKIKNQRTYYLHKLSTFIVNQYDLISVEDLNLVKMKSKNRKNDFTNKKQKFGKKVEEDAYAIFLSQLSYKAYLNGKYFVKIDRYFPSSQLCSNCGTLNESMKNVSNKVLVCKQCGISIDRDLNSAINIKNEGIRIYKEKFKIK